MFLSLFFLNLKTVVEDQYEGLGHSWHGGTRDARAGARSNPAAGQLHGLGQRGRDLYDSDSGVARYRSVGWASLRSAQPTRAQTQLDKRKNQ